MRGLMADSVSSNTLQDCSWLARDESLPIHHPHNHLNGQHTQSLDLKLVNSAGQCQHETTNEIANVKPKYIIETHLVLCGSHSICGGP